MAGQPLKVILAQPRGFCAGVERAIEIVERALQAYGPPVYVRHEIVHNKRVVDRLRQKGAVFVEAVEEIPAGAATIFSAHGVSDQVEASADRRGLQVIDATCPLVTKVHTEGRRYSRRGYDVVLIGHAGHPEVEGTTGRIPGPVHLVSTVEDVARLAPRDPDQLAYVTQTTLSIDDTRDIIAALKHRFPRVLGPDVRDICYATQNRQAAVRDLAAEIEILLVVGANNSSNSNRLREIGEDMGKPSYLVEDGDSLREAWLDGISIVGLTAGASAPEALVEEVVDRLADWRDIQLEVLSGTPEDVHFKLPPGLRESRPVPK